MEFWQQELLPTLAIVSIGSSFPGTLIVLAHCPSAVRLPTLRQYTGWQLQMHLLHCTYPSTKQIMNIQYIVGVGIAVVVVVGFSNLAVFLLAGSIRHFTATVTSGKEIRTYNLQYELLENRLWCNQRKRLCFAFYMGSTAQNCRHQQLDHKSPVHRVAHTCVSIGRK